MIFREVSGVDNNIGVLICDVTTDQLKSDATQQGYDLIIMHRNVAVKGS